MAEMLSPCCGAEYTDNDNGASCCCGAKISESGLCYDCRDYAEPCEGYLCEKCDEFFDEPTEDYEFDEQMKERIAEDKADEARDMKN
jgi:hypothetical protein